MPKREANELSTTEGFVQRADWDVEAVEHRDEKIAERPFALLLDEAAVAQAEVSASSEDGRIVAGVVGGAGAAAVQGQGVVEQAVLAFADRAEALEEVGELLKRV